MAEHDTERMEEDVERINKAALTMQRLLDELLELSRIGRLVNPSQEVSLSELARRAVDRFAEQIAERKIEVLVSEEMGIVVG